MRPGDGKIALMGSGELGASMVEVHKVLLRSLPEPRLAAFIDTPAGFQLNVDEISRKAAAYFQRHLEHPLRIASFKNREEISGVAAEQAFRTLRQADYILMGPGSPTYALSQWRSSPIPEILVRRVAAGACLTAASAAALTVGRFTLPVYEIYKVGEPLHWVEGLDLLGRFGLDLVVVPHWNNAEGGSHDTRCCFMGESRFMKLQALLPQPVPVLGIDEHTACILDFDAGTARVRGLGSVTLRAGGTDRRFAAGESFALGVLAGDPRDSAGAPSPDRRIAAPDPSPSGPPVPGSAVADSFWGRIHALETDFENGLAGGDFRIATNALLELDRLIWQAQTDLESADAVVQARDTLRESLVRLGTERAAGAGNVVDSLAPLVEGLLRLRETWRAAGQWAAADAIRDLLGRVRIVVEDTTGGVRWRLKP